MGDNPTNLVTLTAADQDKEKVLETFFSEKS
jgi:hypothetical protein